MNMNINFDAFLHIIPYSLKGMAGVFTVTGIIIIAIVLLERSQHDNSD